MSWDVRKDVVGAKNWQEENGIFLKTNGRRSEQTKKKQGFSYTWYLTFIRPYWFRFFTQAWAYHALTAVDLFRSDPPCMSSSLRMAAPLNGYKPRSFC